MLIDWIHWLSSVPNSQLILILAPVLLLDIPRYALGSVAMWLLEFVRDLFRGVVGRHTDAGHGYCPSVCVIVAGLNEAETVGHTIRSLIGTYPRLEIIVVDDGSTDGMSDVAREAARGFHDVVSVLRKPQRGGKSSALNFALPFTQAEILVCVDSDSHLEPGAIWEIVQPFTDARVGAVSGAVFARNAFDRVVCWLQALEYLRSIFVGRMIAARLDMLGIVSGAFGAFRRSAVCRLKGWDVGPGEDGDLTLRLRKSGYRIAFAPYAQCLTNVPTSWWRLMKQRRRWEWAVITFECRKHVDLANPLLSLIHI
jgi:cellulose synthase/poly-beta-1,6-N-acetylglucosamine synthase-like glycosyltransferase